MMVGIAAGSRIGIVGSGVMARGLARLCDEGGYAVALWSRSRPDELRAWRDEHLASAAVARDPEDLGGCPVILEATVEDAAAKAEVLAAVALAGDGVIATTTSSLSVTALAAAVDRPERFIGLHFFNPVAKMRLVEVVPGVRTSSETQGAAHRFGESLGKTTVTAPDRAGFIVNRLIFPLLFEAARLVEAGHATPEEIDDAIRHGLEHPMGPLALLDFVGLDVAEAIGDALYAETRSRWAAPPHGLRERVAAGMLGRKSGRGYLAYEAAR